MLKRAARVFSQSVFFVGLMLLLVVSVVVVYAAQDKDVARPIRLQAVIFTPTAGELAPVPNALRIEAYVEGESGYYIVQFAGAVQPQWLDLITGVGANVLAYIPDHAFKVRMTPAIAQQVAQLGVVSWVGIFQPAFKISPAINIEEPGVLRILVEQGGDVEAVAAAVAAAGAQVVFQNDHVLHAFVADAGQLAAVAAVSDVAWIENYVLLQKFNDAARNIMGATAAAANGFDGTGQIAAVADTGLGNGLSHAGIVAGRIVAIHDWPGQAGALGLLCNTGVVTHDGSRDVDSGHGTHVANSVLGSGNGSGIGRGIAPGAQLVFQSTEDYTTVTGFGCAIFGITNGYYLLGLPDPLGPLFQQAYDDGARVHSNSWGAAVAGQYTANSQQADAFMWSHEDMLIVFAAGNDGQDAAAPLGEIDPDSIGAPGTAKNVLTVGASEAQRTDNYSCDSNLTYIPAGGSSSCNSQGGVNSIPTWTAFGFTSAPLSTDSVADNSQQMAGFSSRGPTDDGRIKPDVVAPGSWILSGYSDLYQQQYDDPGGANPQNGAYQYDGYGFPYDNEYKYMGGTSMATPLVSGAAAVVRQYYADVFGATASAALVKATLINSANDLLDENNDGVNDNDYPIPNNHEGWGLVDLDEATSGNRRFVDVPNSSGVTTGATQQYTYYTCGGATTSLKVSLVWTDAEGNPAVTNQLVNNLDLTVVGPDGAFLGNVFGGGWSTTGGTADSLNNVENVYIQNPSAGTWTMNVNGANVPGNGGAGTTQQGYALVVTTAGSTCTPTAVSLTSSQVAQGKSLPIPALFAFAVLLLLSGGYLWRRRYGS